MTRSSTNESHADSLDRATELQMLETEGAIALVRKNHLRPKQLPGPDGVYPEPDCIDCGQDIGIGRLKVAINNTICIYCATALERRG